MSDAPERIWADDAGGWWRLESDEDPGALIEYTRADLHDALRARIAELEAALEIIAGRRQCMDNMMGNRDVAIWVLDRGIKTDE